MEEDYALVSFLRRGRRRRAVLQALDHPKTPKELSVELELSISNISVTLGELRFRNLAKCLNPEDHIERFYAHTERWKKIAAWVESKL